MKTLSSITVYMYLIIWPFILIGKGSDKIRLNNSLENTNIEDTIYLGSYLKIDTLDLAVLPPSNGVQFYREGIIYLTSTKSNQKISAAHQSFGKMDVSYSILDNYMPSNPVNFSKNEPFAYPCDAVTFGPDFNKMYFTRYFEGSEKIFEAFISPSGNSSNNWIYDTIPLDFCTGKSDYTHPALSTDGKMLVFSSDRADTEGGMDLYFSLLKDNKWTTPANLGSSVNSVSNESYPFLDSDNNLYFSSDRPGGSGGYDIYFCKYNGVAWNDPENLSVPVNTGNDDIAFTISKKDPKTAFYSVRQRSGSRQIQILSLTLSTISSVSKFTGLSQMFISAIPTGKKLALANLPKIDSSTLKAPPRKIEEAEPKPAAEKGQVQKEVVAEKISQDVKQKEVVTEKAPPIREQKKPDVEKRTIVPEQKKDIQKTEEINKTESKSLTQDIITYRVQIKSAMKTTGSVKIKISDVEYDTYDYLYKGAYRICVGLYRTLTDAVALQNKCRKSGYPQAFVVAFKNNVRSTDPALFKK